MVELSIALCCASIAASVPEIRLPKIQNYARCLARKGVKTWTSGHGTNGGQVGLVVVGSISASSSAREGLHAQWACWISVRTSTLSTGT